MRGQVTRRRSLAETKKQKKQTEKVFEKPTAGRVVVVSNDDRGDEEIENALSAGPLALPVVSRTGGGDGGNANDGGKTL